MTKKRARRPCFSGFDAVEIRRRLSAFAGTTTRKLASDRAADLADYARDFWSAELAQVQAELAMPDEALVAWVCCPIRLFNEDRTVDAFCAAMERAHQDWVAAGRPKE